MLNLTRSFAFATHLLLQHLDKISSRSSQDLIKILQDRLVGWQKQNLACQNLRKSFFASVHTSLERSSQARFNNLLRPYQNIVSSVLFLFFICFCKILLTGSLQNLSKMLSNPNVFFVIIAIARSQQIFVITRSFFKVL